MIAFVLDASITLSWCFGDESSQATWDLLDMLQTRSAMVPSIWSLEVTSILTNAERKKRLTEAKIFEFLHLLEQLNIEADSETSSRAFHQILQLSRTHVISTYESAYLELAMRLGVPLATKDKQLRAVSSKLGVKILPARISQ